MTPTCSNCRFWFDHERASWDHSGKAIMSTTGFCRRYAPRASCEQALPITEADFWCGEHEPIPSQFPSPEETSAPSIRSGMASGQGPTQVPNIRTQGPLLHHAAGTASAIGPEADTECKRESVFARFRDRLRQLEALRLPSLPTYEFSPTPTPAAPPAAPPPATGQIAPA